jgi:hypothetical protein
MTGHRRDSTAKMRTITFAAKLRVAEAGILTQ